MLRNAILLFIKQTIEKDLKSFNDDELISELDNIAKKYRGMVLLLENIYKGTKRVIPEIIAEN